MPRFRQISSSEAGELEEPTETTKMSLCIFVCVVSRSSLLWGWLKSGSSIFTVCDLDCFIYQICIRAAGWAAQTFMENRKACCSPNETCFANNHIWLIQVGSYASIWLHTNARKTHVAQHHFWIPLDRRKVYKRMNMCSYSHTTQGFYDFSSHVCFSMMGSDFSVKESGINSVALVVGCTRLRMEIW